MNQPEKLRLNIIFAIISVLPLVGLVFQTDIAVGKRFGGAIGKFISSAVLVLSCLALHFLQGAFNQFANVLTAAIAFYFVANFLPNWGMGAPSFRNAANSADLSPSDVSELAARFLFVVLALQLLLYVFFSLAGSDIAFLPSANNAYRRIVKMDMMTSA